MRGYHFKASNISSNEANRQHVPPVILRLQYLNITFVISWPAKGTYPDSGHEEKPHITRKKF